MDKIIKIPNRGKEISEMKMEEIEKYVKELEYIVHRVLDFKDLLEKVTR